MSKEKNGETTSSLSEFLAKVQQRYKLYHATPETEATRQQSELMTPEMKRMIEKFRNAKEKSWDSRFLDRTIENPILEK